MANIRLKRLFEAEDFQAKSKETGKLVHFKSKDSYQAAIKAGTHEDPKAKKGDAPKASVKPNDMFGGDYSKDRGGEKSKETPIKHTKVGPDSPEIQTIAKYAGVREKFLADFINQHKLDAAAVANFVEKGSKEDRKDFFTAAVGNPGNEYEKKIIDKFGAKEVTSKSPSDMGVDSVVYNKRTNAVGIVRMGDERGETKTDADGNVNTSELEPYNPMKYPHQKDAKVAPSTQKEVDARGLWNPFAQTQPSAPKADVKSIVKDLLKKGDKEFRGAYKLKDVVDDFKDNIDDTDEDGKELKARLDKGEDGTYVQTDETEGTVVFNDGSQYEFAHVEDGPIPVTKVGKEEPNTSSKLTSMLPKKTNYDDKSYWKDKEYGQGSQSADDDYDDDDSWGEGPQFTSDRLSKIEDALEDELNLRGNGFETTRESSGGMGGWEGPMTIVSKDADYDDDNYISLSVGSPNNDGKMSIVFANQNGEPYFEPNYDSLTGDTDLEPQQAYKVTKALMKMPEVQKLLKGEMNRDAFQPIYDKLKSKFSKTK